LKKQANARDAFPGFDGKNCLSSATKDFAIENEESRGFVGRLFSTGGSL
jgi:hypothetical protein